MFKLYFGEQEPTTYRQSYQTNEIKVIINELIDYLFFEENIIMMNTGSCMFATTLTQKDVDRLSEALLNGFRLLKPKLDKISLI